VGFPEVSWRNALIRTGETPERGAEVRETPEALSGNEATGCCDEADLAGDGGEAEQLTERALDKFNVVSTWQAGNFDPTMEVSKEAVVVGE
jgi:hypothetical protein